MQIILETLPNCYSTDPEQKEIADALTRALADKYEVWMRSLDSYEKERLDPATADTAWLDALAHQLGWGDLWDSTWSVEIKRSLLTNTDFIWANRGNREAIAFLFATFKLNARLKPTTGWILGQSLLPASLTASPFAYNVEVPNNYIDNSPEQKLVRRLLKLFMPCWVSFSIVRV